mgnify:CR=1 FL=1
MAGVSDTSKFYCKQCKKETLHETDWESESPDKLWTECAECKLVTFE